jgi:hypothetical protein
MEAFNKDLADSGELVETRALAAPVLTRRLQLRNGVPVVTDGPYAEAQEVPCSGRTTVSPNTRAWLITVASRRLTDLLRGEQARRRREDTVASRAIPFAMPRRPAQPTACRRPPRALPDLQRGYASTSGPSCTGASWPPRTEPLEHRRHRRRVTLITGALPPEATGSYPLQAAARRTTNLPQQRHLHTRAARLTDDR